MIWLLFSLAAPLASFGRAGAVETRGSEPVPTRSALLGLLGAALGIRRDDSAALDTLAASVRFACRIERSGRLLRDFHTVQTPPQPLLKKAPHRTRRDELAFPSSELRTVLSTRDYHEDFRATVGVACSDAGAAQRLADALERPRFVLYLGRKTCALAWPLAPCVVEAAQWEVALEQFDARRDADLARWRESVRGRGLKWPLERGSQEQHAIERELADTISDPRQWRETHERDEPRDRQRWLFAPHVWLERADARTPA